MEYKTFVRLVGEMRSAQQDYFAQHTQSALRKAKALERDVDRAVLQFLGEQATVEQGQLFDQREQRAGHYQ